MNKRSIGAYAQRNFHQDTAERERLKLQATIAIEWERKAWHEAGLREGMHVLDLGCGPGYTSREILKQIGSDGHVTGVDVNPSLLEIAKSEQENIPNLSFQQANVYELPFPTAHFDFVHARFVFQHLADPIQALAQIHRTLKPGGICCIVDIDDNWTSFTPASSSFRRFVQASAKAQSRKNGNRKIGSELPRFMRNQPFLDVKTQIVPLTSTQIGMRPFMGLALSFRMDLMSFFQRIRLLNDLKKIQQAAADPHAWGAVGIFISSGTKPI